MHQPIYIASINEDPFTAKPLPLTEKNLKNLEDVYQPKSVSNELLERYCRKMMRSAAIAESPLLSYGHRERCHSTPPVLQDLVVASPRILPFPYHNDSMFLPTAEHVQYLRSSTDSSTVTSRAGSMSTPPTNNSSPYISRPHSTANIVHTNSNQSISNLSQPSIGRRSLPARLDRTKLVISPTSSNNNIKQRFLSRTSSFSTTSSSGSSIQEEPFESQQQSMDSNKSKKLWLKRILKVFNKDKINNKKSEQKQTNVATNGNIDQVWYCQYAKNPSPKFQNYYNQPMAVVS